MLCVVALPLLSCSFAPLTPCVDAASIGKHELKLETNIGPTPSIGALYGVGENLDIGVELEQFAMGNTDLGNTDPDNTDQYCSPTISFSFYRL